MSETNTSLRMITKNICHTHDEEQDPERSILMAIVLR